MIPARSDVLDFDEEDGASSERRPPTLVSLHFIRSALRRRWLVCALSAVLGLLVATAALIAFPVAHHAKASLVLAHEPEVDPTRAMATDVSLLRTRTVASQTIARLGLTTTPDEFLKSVTVVPVSAELMELTLIAPTDAEAVRRLDALMSVYLKFRAEQLSARSNSLVAGMQQRIETLQKEVAGLSRRIDQLSAANSASASKLSDTISQRSYVQGRIDTLRQSIEDATLQNTAVVQSSAVLDPAAAELGGAKRRMALALASGLIGGAALGCGMVLFFAITSDRLRRRSDVAAALEVPVPVSVGRITPLPKRWLWFPHLRTIDGRRGDDRQRLAHAIEMELPVPMRSGRLAVVCIDNADEVRTAIAAGAIDLAARGCKVTLIELTKDDGSLDLGVVPSIPRPTPMPTVLRPRGIPELASSAADLSAIGMHDVSATSLDLSDAILVLADLDPSVGADYLRAWTHRVIVVVTAGRSSAESVRTAADLVRTAGLELRVAALLHTERTDDSSGTAGFDRPLPTYVLDGQHPLRKVESQPATDEHVTIAANAAQAAAVQELATLEDQTSDQQEAFDEEITALQDQPTPFEQTPDEEHATDEEATAVQELATLEDQTSDQQEAFDEEIAAPQDQPTPFEQTPDEEHATDEEATAVQELATLKDQSSDQQMTFEEEIAALQKAFDEEIAALQDQLTPFEQTPDEEHATDEEATAVQELATLKDQTSDQQEAFDEEIAALQDQPTPFEQTPDEEHATDEEATAALQGQPVDEEQNAEEQILDDEPTIEIRALAPLTPALQEHWSADLTRADEGAAEALDPSADEAEEQGLDNERTANRRAPTALSEEATADLEHADDHVWTAGQALTLAAELAPDDEQPAVEEQVPDEEQTTPIQEQPGDVEQTAADLTASRIDLAADTDQIAEPPQENTNADSGHRVFAEYPLGHDGTAASSENHKSDWSWDSSLDNHDSEHESVVLDRYGPAVPAAEPDHTLISSGRKTTLDGWDLYIDVYGEVESLSGEPSLTTSQNGEQPGPVPDVGAEARDGVEQPAGVGQASNRRTRRKRSRRSRKDQANSTSTRVN
jgi:hypothetical protein